MVCFVCVGVFFSLKRSVSSKFESPSFSLIAIIIYDVTFGIEREDLVSNLASAVWVFCILVLTAMFEHGYEKKTLSWQDQCSSIPVKITAEYGIAIISFCVGPELFFPGGLFLKSYHV